MTVPRRAAAAALTALVMAAAAAGAAPARHFRLGAAGCSYSEGDDLERVTVQAPLVRSRSGSNQLAEWATTVERRGAAGAWSADPAHWSGRLWPVTPEGFSRLQPDTMSFEDLTGSDGYRVKVTVKWWNGERTARASARPAAYDIEPAVDRADAARLESCPARILRVWRGGRDDFQRGVMLGVSRGYTPASGDFDGDGRWDVFWHGPGEAVADLVWWGSSAGTHDTSELSLTTAFIPVSGDFDGDRRWDVFWYVPGDEGGDAHWWGRADRTFDSKIFDTVNGTYVPISGDFDGDGRWDIFWYGPGTDVDRQWYGTGRSRFNELNDASVAVPVDGVYRPVSGDFDGDGYWDIFWHGPGSNDDMQWYGTRVRNEFVVMRQSVNGAYQPFSGDFDGDGYWDVFWYGEGFAVDRQWFGTPDRNRFREENGAGAENVEGTYEPVSGDFDGDGDWDVLWYD